MKKTYAICGNIILVLTFHRWTRRLVHRLVALAFIPNRERKRFVDHIDRDRHNNHIDNLRWVTYKENAHHNGGGNWKPGLRKLTSNQVIAIRKKFSEGRSKNSLSKEYDVAFATIANICNRKTWRDV